MESNIKDSVVEDVRQDLLNRSEAGIKKYNTTLDRTDLVASDWVQHAYEEALDMALYLKRLRKDMLMMEKELREYKTEKMIESKLREEAILKQGKISVTTTSGTEIVYHTPSVGKPNETYMDEEPVKPKIRGWHY